MTCSGPGGLSPLSSLPPSALHSHLSTVGPQAWGYMAIIERHEELYLGEAIHGGGAVARVVHLQFDAK